MEFSSPSGDGLVPRLSAGGPVHAKIFVPEWGWVGSYTYGGYTQYNLFSSPSGDGLVQNAKENKRNKGKSFRPRVGMGWFLFFPHMTINRAIVFVPAWGWVGSAWQGNIDFNKVKFSSPSGDGLVRYS